MKIYAIIVRVRGDLIKDVGQCYKAPALVLTYQKLDICHCAEIEYKDTIMQVVSEWTRIPTTINPMIRLRRWSGSEMVPTFCRQVDAGPLGLDQFYPAVRGKYSTDFTYWCPAYPGNAVYFLFCIRAGGKQ